MKTIELFNASQFDGWLYLIQFDNDQYLALKRQKDGRLDLVDIGCDDTGSDFSDSSYEELEAEIANWLNCIECSDEEKESAWQQVARA